MAGPWEQFQAESPSLTELPWERYRKEAEVEPQFARSLAQGALFGFADELEAMARSAVPGSPDYETIRNEIRQKLKAYQEANPGTAISAEILGAAAPTVLMMMTGVGAPAAEAQAARLAPQIMRATGIGALEGGIAAYGTGEQGIVEDIARIPGGAAIGAVASGGTTAAMRPAGSLFNNMVDYARTKMGDKAANVVNTEIQRLAEATGLPPDEVVQRVADGSIMAENETLLATVRAYRSRPGEASAAISEALPLRRIKTREDAMQALQQGLAPQAGPTSNVYRAMRMSQEEFKKNESSAYRDIFARKQEVGSGTIDSITEALNRIPGARGKLDEIYQARGGLVPFYKFDDAGKLEIVRMPTLEDAEIVRRAAQEAKDSAFREGRGAVGESVGEVERKLRQQIDSEAPDLGETRAAWRQMNVARNAFDNGRKAIGKNADEIEDEFLRIRDTGDVGAIRAYRAGVMDSIRNRARRSPGLMRNLADPDRQEGAILRIVFPESEIQGVVDLAARAGRAQRAEQVVMQGSMTAPEQAAGRQIGGRFSPEEATRALQGDPTAMIGLGARLVRSLAPDMSDAQRKQVVDVLLSENPDVVRRALFDETALANLQNLINRIGSTVAESTRRGITMQAGEAGGAMSGGLLDRMTGAQ